MLEIKVLLESKNFQSLRIPTSNQHFNGLSWKDFKLLIFLKCKLSKNILSLQYLKVNTLTWENPAIPFPLLLYLYYLWSASEAAFLFLGHFKTSSLQWSVAQFNLYKDWKMNELQTSPPWSVILHFNYVISTGVPDAGKKGWGKRLLKGKQRGK